VFANHVTVRGPDVPRGRAGLRAAFPDGCCARGKRTGTRLRVEAIGFSSLAYLRELPVHAVKLDKSFVTHLHDRADDRSIVNGTVRMALALGLKVVAEGVETEWTAPPCPQRNVAAGS
jgi:hypothetical protein